ncbi:ABC transporter ATP-binding protein [Lacticaseibacillus absianus]|uniref:ATP-binding cassette domain-containing protein n=1 Tax=Lacticaseibacillus absianus TaxID=2729623 RepID=UPI0015C960F5|nr:ABC transporter ATP-binding protein [Lacticaseibacillus absianus]
MSELVFKNVTKNYGEKRVLRGVNMTWQSGQIYGLLGRNGAGKSTLMRIVNNRTFASGGALLLDGQSVVENEQAQNRIFLMSDAMLYPADKRIEWLFKLTAQMYGDFDWDLAQDLAHQFKLDVRARLGRLSTGYRTIAKLIIALCVPCEFILLDEPVLGLDAVHRELFYRALLQAYGTRPRTFVLSTHIIDEIAGLISHVFVLEGGQIALDEDLDELMAKGRVVSGPAALVQEWLSGVAVLRREQLGGMVTAYTLDAPLEKPLPAGVTLAPMNLQKLFIELTMEAETNGQ